jgi:RDD family
MAKRPRNHGSLAAAAGRAGTAEAGIGSAPLATPAGADAGADYPGKRYGLPQQGPMSMASMGRRLLALVIDWLLCMVIAIWLAHSQYWTLAIFAVEVCVLTALTGTTVGMRLCGIRVVRTDGGLVGFRWALVRTVLLLTVVLPLLTDYDRRGIHDRAADTMVVRI